MGCHCCLLLLSVLRDLIKEILGDSLQLTIVDSVKIGIMMLSYEIQQSIFIYLPKTSRKQVNIMMSLYIFSYDLRSDKITGMMT